MRREKVGFFYAKQLVVFGICMVAILAISFLSGSRAHATAIPVDNSNIFWSPYGWVANGSVYKQSPTVGSYINVAFSGDTLALNVDNSFVTNPANLSVAAFIDGNSTPIVRTLADVSAGRLTFSTSLSSGNHFARIVIRHNSNYSTRWNVTGGTPISTLRITSIEISDSGSILTLSSTPLAAKTPRVLYYGDSITEGNGVGSGDVFGYNSVGSQVGWLLGSEYGIKGYASSMWHFNIISGVPDFFYAAGGSYNTAVWKNNYQGRSLLNDVNTPSSGFIEGAPDAIYNNLGINDRALYSNPTWGGTGGLNSFRNKVRGWFPEVRQAVGGRTAIFMVVPFNYNCTAAINPAEDGALNQLYKNAYVDAYNDYITTSGDTRTFLIDLGAEGCQIAYDEGDGAGLHPNATGAHQLAELIVGQTQQHIILEEDVEITAEADSQALSDGMNLNNPPTINGTAPAGTTVTLTLTQDGNDTDCVTVANGDGDWSCTFSQLLAGGEYSLGVVGEASWGEMINFGTFTVSIEVDDSSSNTGSSGSSESTSSERLASSGVNIQFIVLAAVTTMGAATVILRKQLGSN